MVIEIITIQGVRPLRQTNQISHREILILRGWKFDFGAKRSIVSTFLAYLSICCRTLRIRIQVGCTETSAVREMSSQSTVYRVCSFVLGCM